MRKKVISIVAVCLALLVAVQGCGANDKTDRIDTGVGVSALVALADSHISGYVNAMEALVMTQEVQSGDWGKMVGILSKVEQSQVRGTMWFVLPDGSYSTVELGKTSASLTDRAYFPKLMAGNKVLGDLVVSKSTGKKSIVAAVPVVRQGKVIGGVGFRFSWMT